MFASSPDAQRWVWDDYTHRRPFTRKSFRLLFEDQGFQVERVGYESVMPGTGIVSGWTRATAGRAAAAAAWLPVVRRNVAARAPMSAPRLRGAAARAPDELLAPAALEPPRRPLRRRGAADRGHLVRHGVVGVSPQPVRTLRDLLPPGRVGDLAARVPGRPLPGRRALAGADIVHPQDLGFWYSMQAARLKRELGYKLVLTVWETLPSWRLPQRAHPSVPAAGPRGDRPLPCRPSGRAALLLEGAPRSESSSARPAWTRSAAPQSPPATTC